MPTVVDLTGPDSPPNPFNPPSGLSITKKRKRSPDSEVEFTGFKPAVIRLDQPESLQAVRSKEWREKRRSRQGSRAGSSRAGSRAQSTMNNPSSAPSSSRPGMSAQVVLKVEEGGWINLISDDEEEVVELVRPISATPDHHIPPPPRSSLSASTPRGGDRVSQTAHSSGSRKTPTVFVGSSVFSDPSKLQPGVQLDKGYLESLETEEEYDSLIPVNRFKSMETNPHRLSPSREDDAAQSDNESVDSEAADQLSQKLARERLLGLKPPNSVCPYPTLDAGLLLNEYLLRDMHRSCENYNPRKRRRQRKATSLRGDWDYTRRSLEGELGLEHLKLTASFKQCPGSIVCVEQSHGYVAIAGACTGGAEDTPDEVRDAYNREGSLMTFFRQRECPTVILQGHQNAERFPGRTAEDTEGRIKYYGLTDVKFCPADADWFVTSGNDRHVKIWHRQYGSSSHKAVIKHKMPCGVPNSLVFKPESKTLAVAERSIFISQNITDLDSRYSKLEGQKDGQVVGEMRWGQGNTTGSLFASSEPTDERKYTGSWHRTYDVERAKVSVRFDLDEAGDAMALDAVGDRLAIVTRTSRTNSNLRIYDVRDKNPNPVQELELEPFDLANADDEDEAGEHRDVQFSPDGVFIALARYDNRVHVYDARFIKRKGLLYDFRHSTVTRINPGLQPYGVSKLEWVYQGSRLGLVTGGSDGCVRLWNPLEAASNPRNGQPIATVNSDIASFSLGDRYKGEHQLVVGDCAGEVSIFNRFFDTDFPYK